MSGGKKKGGNDGGGKSPQLNPCQSINEDTWLYSPAPIILSTLKIGDELKIQLNQTDGRAQLIAVTNKGDVVGSILGAIMVDLIDCIKKGFTYKGVVKDMSGGSCVIKVKYKG